MRPLATKQRSAAHNSRHNDRSTDFFDKLPDLHLTKIQDDKQLKTADAPVSYDRAECDMMPTDPHPRQDSNETPPVVQHCLGQDKASLMPMSRKDSLESTMAGAPFLPGSPDLSLPASVRFPDPLFSPIPGGATEFRPCPELLAVEQPNTFVQRPRLPPPSIPLSPELMVRPTRALQMKKSEPMDVPFS